MAAEACSLVAQFLYERGYRNSLRAFEQESGYKCSLNDLEKQGKLLRILDEYYDLTRDKVTNHSWFHFTEEGVSFANKLLMCLDSVSYGANVLTVRLTPDGVLGVGSARGFLSILDLGTPIKKQTEIDLPLEDPVHEAGLLTMDFNPQVSNLLLTGSMDRKVHLLEVSTEKVNVLQTFQDHRKYVVRVRWAPSGRFFATASYDNSVCLYRREDGPTEDETSFKLCKRFEFKGQIESIAFRKRCDELIVAVRDDNTLYVIDMMGEELRKLRQLNMNALGDDYVSFTAMDISCSPDDKLLLVSTDQSRLILYTIEDGKQVANFYGCTNDEFSQPRHCWHPTGRYIYSTSQDKSIKVWDVGTQGIVHSLAGHTDMVRDIFYCEQLSVLVTCGFDGTVRVWHRPDHTPQQTSKSDASECEARQDAL